MMLLNRRIDFCSALDPRLRFQGFFAFIVRGRMLVFAILIGLLVFSLPQSGAGQDGESGVAIRVVTKSTEDGIVLVVQNVPDVKSTSVKVWLGKANAKTDPAMLGTVSRSGDEIVFQPRFPLRAGAKYNVQVATKDAGKPNNFLVEIPREEIVPTRVEQIYPSSDVLPENTLKFYVHFSAPMRKGDVYRYLQIRQLGGGQVELPFLEIEQEFWSRDSKRLTLLLDPGRIKRGLKPREEMGPIFVKGKTYELVVDGSWPDGNGQPVGKDGKDFVKRFRIAEEDHQQPDPGRWKTKLPRENSKEPLVILFREPLDHSMLQTAIMIVNDQSRAVEGQLGISKNETQWSLTPNAPWRSGTYTIEINSRLEDNVGNSVEKQFDVDVFNKTQTTRTKATKLTFEVGQGK